MESGVECREEACGVDLALEVGDGSGCEQLIRVADPGQRAEAAEGLVSNYGSIAEPNEWLERGLDLARDDKPHDALSQIARCGADSF